jgi:cyclopropane fatty-acyl-phospholipid synthase-like methyltransferase
VGHVGDCGWGLVWFDAVGRLTSVNSISIDIHKSKESKRNKKVNAPRMEGFAIS